jgi:hypothetical protein
MNGLMENCCSWQQQELKVDVMDLNYHMVFIRPWCQRRGKRADCQLLRIETYIPKNSKDNLQVSQTFQGNFTTYPKNTAHSACSSTTEHVIKKSSNKLLPPSVME